MQSGSRVALAGCSNGLSEKSRAEIERLEERLGRLGLETVRAEHLFACGSVHSAWGEERAAALMRLWRDPAVAAIFDVTGGDLANEVIPFLDYDAIARSRAQLWGYSDLTCVLNAIYARTGKRSVLYQARNLVREDGEGQTERFADCLRGGRSLFEFGFTFLQGAEMEGVVVGGNARCLLKLAGTEYWPDLRGRILLLEGYGTTIAQAAAYFAQLAQLGAFRQAAGVLLGTFTKLDQTGSDPGLAELLMRWTGPELPIARTGLIGHGADSRAIVIGESRTFRRA